MATPADLRAAFEVKLKEGIPIPPGEFNQADLDRVKDDKYLQRILDHHENDLKEALNMLWEILIWRKTVGANDINESTLRMEYVKEGAFFPRGRDVDGHLLLVFKSKMHVKGQKDFEEIKKVIIYWFDRIEREESGKAITLFFDMDGCGLGNMDMDLIKYLITLMKLYYPSFLHFIVIYQMPWVLSAAFKIVKSLLPAKAVEKMKFVNKDSLKDVVSPDQALTCWGGKDDYIFEFIPESKVLDHTPKKVTFAEQGESQHSPGEMLRLNPNDFIVFKSENDEMSGQFTITNMDESTVSYKIRTTSPDKFRVRPSSGTLAPGASQTVVIVVQPGFHLKTMLKDRFLVMSVQIPATTLSQQELNDVWKKSSGSKVDEYRLKCQFPDKEIPKNGTVVDGKIQDKSDSVATTLQTLNKNYESLQKQVRSLRIYQFFTLLLTIFTVVLAYLIYKNSQVEGNYCKRI